jgi:phosphatidylserine/phosphatidylglycerophosphate/cardiolipin synthase-like enzyme
MNTIQTEIVNDIRSATKSIKVAVSWFTDPYIIDELIKKAAERKEVKVIVSGDEWNVIEFERFDKLQRLGAIVNKKGAKEFNQFGFMHTKFMVVDDSITREGSYNFTKNAQYQDNHFDRTNNTANRLEQFNELFGKSVDFFSDVDNPAEIRANLSILEEQGAIPEEKLQRLAELKLKKAEEKIIQQQKDIEQAEQAKKEAEAKTLKEKLAREKLLAEQRVKDQQNQYGLKQDAPPISEAPPRSYANEQ